MSPVRRRRLREVAVRRADVLGALVWTAVVVATVAAYAVRNDEPIVLLLIPVSLASVLLRRDRPHAALAVAVAVFAATPDNRGLLLPVMAALYTIAARASWKPVAVAGAGAAVVSIVAGAAWGGAGATEHGGILGYAIGTAASYAAAVAVGLYIGAQRRVRDGLRERAERLDRERELLAERAVAQERVRIAQELHDIVAHTLSLMVVKAQALGATANNAAVTEDTDAIADLGRQAMDEMHTTLRLLRADDAEGADRSPQPGLDQLERLIDQLRGAGLEIELTVEGQHRPLPQAVDLSAFRIIQEALTNVVKHAASASTKVTVLYQPDGIELTIIDIEDERSARPRREPSEGHGVIGMRERAALFGGTLITEALAGGFKVQATLPYAPRTS